MRKISDKQATVLKTFVIRDLASAVADAPVSTLRALAKRGLISPTFRLTAAGRKVLQHVR